MTNSDHILRRQFAHIVKLGLGRGVSQRLSGGNGPASCVNSAADAETAGRALVEELCGRRGLPLFVLHDFDKTGFSIHETLTNDNDRFQFADALENVHEIGLRLADIRQFEESGEPLQAEPVAFKPRRNDEDEDESLDVASANLAKNGATDDEINFLLTPADGHDTGGKRVELNAMTSRQMIDLVEGKLDAYGLAKVLPDAEMLAAAYAAFERGAKAQEALEAELERLSAAPVEVPADLEERVRAYLMRIVRRPGTSPCERCSKVRGKRFRSETRGSVTTVNPTMRPSVSYRSRNLRGRSGNRRARAYRGSGRREAVIKCRAVQSSWQSSKLIVLVWSICTVLIACTLEVLLR